MHRFRKWADFGYYMYAERYHRGHTRDLNAYLRSGQLYPIFSQSVVCQVAYCFFNFAPNGFDRSAVKQRIGRCDWLTMRGQSVCGTVSTGWFLRGALTASGEWVLFSCGIVQAIQEAPIGVLTFTVNICRHGAYHQGFIIVEVRCRVLRRLEVILVVAPIQLN